MLEMGARFTNNLYVKLSFDPDSGDCDVVVIAIFDNKEVTLTGSVTWDE